MNRIRPLLILSTLALLLCSTAIAGARITVQSDAPATVKVDGKSVGKTPMQIDLKYSGRRKVEVYHAATGLSYVYRVRSPERGVRSRLIRSSFVGAPPVSGPIVNQVTLAAPPAPLATPTRKDWSKRQKVRIRNTILGGGLANALFNHGPHRHGIFVGLFIAGLLNEIFHD